MPACKAYRTRRLVLRPLRLSDHQAWCAALDAAGKKVSSFDIPYEQPSLRLRSNFVKAVKREAREAERDIAYTYNIFHRTNGELIGWLGLSTICRHPHQMANLSYHILRHQRGNGYGTEAVRCLVKAGFRDLGYHRLEAAMDLHNRPSIALARSVGLHDEGTKKHYWFQNGRWEDQKVFIAIPELFR